MPKHIHLIWQIKDGLEKGKVQQSFLKYTAQQMKFMLAKTNEAELPKYKVKASDRDQFRKRNPLSIDLWNRPVFLQKLNYIHYNPIQAHWKLCKYPEEYRYSSSKFYEEGADEFCFLTHYLA